MNCRIITMKFVCALSFFVLFAAYEYVEAQSKPIVCYYGTWATYRPGNGQYNVEHIDPFACTHLVYAFFGLLPSGHLTSLDEWLDLDSGRGNIRLFNNLKQQNPNLKTLLAVGGWNEGSEVYSDVASDPVRRRIFAVHARELLQEHNFDGLDIDWEYPGQRGGNPAIDRDNFSLWLEDIRAEFAGTGFMLTAAVGATASSATISYDIPRISNSLDMINLMAYDFNGPWDAQTGANAALRVGPMDVTAEQQERNVQAVVDFWLSRGAPANKIILGVPFYGHTFNLVNAGNNGVGAAANGAGLAGPYTQQAGFLGYNEICTSIGSKWNVQWDAAQEVPFAHAGNEWLSFDNVQSMEAKTRYINTRGLGGAMVWSIETDDFRNICAGGRDPLLQAIRRVLA